MPSPVKDTEKTQQLKERLIREELQSQKACFTRMVTNKKRLERSQPQY